MVGAELVRIYCRLLDDAPIVSAPLGDEVAVLIVRIYERAEIQVNDLIPAVTHEPLARHAIEHHRDFCHARVCETARAWLRGVHRGALEPTEAESA